MIKWNNIVFITGKVIGAVPLLYKVGILIIVFLAEIFPAYINVILIDLTSATPSILTSN